MKPLLKVPLWLVLGLVLVLAGCQASGLNREDAEAIRLQLEDVAQRLEAVETRISALARESGDSSLLVSEVRNELTQARSTLAEVDDKLAPPEVNELLDDGLDGPATTPGELGDPLGSPIFD